MASGNNEEKIALYTCKLPTVTANDVENSKMAGEEKINSIKHKILDLTKNNEDVSRLMNQLVDESKKVICIPAPAPLKRSNPAIIGLASFAITATLFQFHNFGWVKVPSVLFLGMILGGLVQMFAGLLEFATGNGFGFAIFSVFGSFWITLVLILLGKMFMGPQMQTSETDMGWFMLTFLIFTFILLISSLKHNTILPLLILTLFLGILFLMISHFCNEASKATVSERPFKLTGAIFLLINSIMAYYFLAAILMEDVYQRKILPVGCKFAYIMLFGLHVLFISFHLIKTKLMQLQSLSYKVPLTIETVSSSPSSPMNVTKSRIKISPAPSVVSLYTFIEAPPNVKIRYKDAARVIWAECPLDKNAIAAHNKGFVNFANPFLIKNSSNIKHRGSLKNDLVDQSSSSQIVSNSLGRDFRYKTNNTIVKKLPVVLDNDGKSPQPISYPISNVQRNFSDYSDIPSIDEEKMDDLDFSKVSRDSNSLDEVTKL